jgi:ABC-type Fe3+-hydroxamate transport system substrate-binding protein
VRPWLIALALLASAAPVAAMPAQRIVTLAPHLAELVHAAGAGDRLVGTVAWSDFPAEVQSLPQVGDAFRLDLEMLAVLAPDLVLAWQGGNPDHMLAQLERHGYRVVALAPERLDDIAAHLEEIGRLAGTQATAQAAAADYRAALAAERRAHAGKPVLRVFYQVSWRPLYTVGGRQLISEVITLCGGENIFAELGELAPERLDDIAAHLEEIGRLAGTQATAQAAAADYRAALAAERRAHAGKPVLRVFYQVSWRPLYTIGGRQLISEVITLCGGENIFAELGELAPAVALEAVLARDPEVILTADIQRAELEEWRRWPGVTAVARDQLYAVDGDLVVRASPRILAGTRQVCGALDQARRGEEGSRKDAERQSRRDE